MRFKYIWWIPVVLMTIWSGCKKDEVTDPNNNNNNNNNNPNNNPALNDGEWVLVNDPIIEFPDYSEYRHMLSTPEGLYIYFYNNMSCELLRYNNGPFEEVSLTGGYFDGLLFSYQGQNFLWHAQNVGLGDYEMGISGISGAAATPVYTNTREYTGTLSYTAAEQNGTMKLFLTDIAGVTLDSLHVFSFDGTAVTKDTVITAPDSIYNGYVTVMHEDQDIYIAFFQELANPGDYDDPVKIYRFDESGLTYLTTITGSDRVQQNMIAADNGFFFMTITPSGSSKIEYQSISGNREIIATAPVTNGGQRGSLGYLCATAYGPSWGKFVYNLPSPVYIGHDYFNLSTQSVEEFPGYDESSADYSIGTTAEDAKALYPIIHNDELYLIRNFVNGAGIPNPQELHLAKYETD